MARPGVTREQIFETADALIREGQSPTVVAVRTRLGGGSPNTITPLLAEWKEQNEIKRAETLPPLPEPVEAAMRQVWGAAWKSSQEQLEAEREALSKVRQEVDRERSEMLAEISRLDRELEAARIEVQKTTETLEHERRAHDQTRSEVKEAQAIAAEREKRIGAQETELREVRRQAVQSESKVSRLEANLSHANKDLEAVQATVVQEAEARAKVERERDQGKSDNERLSAELETVKKTAKQAKTALDLGGKKVEKLEAAIEEERQERTKAEKALGELQVEAATLKERASHAEDLRRLLEEFHGVPGTSAD